MAAAQKGDKAAYKQLLQEVTQYTHGYLSKKMAGRSEVEDVVQEALLTVHRARHTFDPKRGAFRSWLHAIVESRLMDFWRKQKRKEAHETTSEDELSVLIEAPKEISQLDVDEFKVALEELSKNQQDILLALKLEGLTIKEAAERFGMTESTVKVTAHRGYKKLKEALRERE